MRKTIITMLLAGSAFAAAMFLEIPAGHAYGDAPWCAVIDLGTGEAYWDCQYRTVEECAPNVVAGNRGFCNINPSAGPGVPGAVYRLRHRHSVRHRHHH